MREPKLIKSLLFFGISVGLFANPANAIFEIKEKKPEDIAGFCADYSDISDDDAVLRKLRKAKDVGGRVAYQYPNSSEKIYYKDIVKNRYEALDFRLDSSARKFRKKLSMWTAHLSLKAQTPYQEAFDLQLDKEVETELNSCLRKRVSPDIAKMHEYLPEQAGEVKKSLAYKEILFRHFVGAVSLAAIIEKIDLVETEFQKMISGINGEIAVLKFTKSRGAYPSPLDLDKKNEKLHDLNEKRKALIESKDATLFTLKSSYYLLYKDYPLLFEFVNRAKLLNWMNKELEPSRFYEILISDIDPQLWKTLRNRVAVMGNVESLFEIFFAPELEEMFAQIFEGKYKDPELLEAARSSAEAYVNLLNKRTLEVCEQDVAHKLHYNNQLVESLFAQNLKHYAHKRLTVIDQAGYCHLLDQDPPTEKKGLNPTEKIGFKAFGLGAFIHFTTGRVKWASSLYGAGTSAFGYNLYEEQKINSLLLSSTFPLVPNGFISAEKYHELVNRRGEIITENVFHWGLSSGAIVGLKFIDDILISHMLRTYDVKKHEFGRFWKYLKPITRGKFTQGLIRQGDEAARQRYLAITKEKSELLEKAASKYHWAREVKKIRDRLGLYSQNYELSAYLMWKQKGDHLDLGINAITKNAHKSDEGLKKLNKFKDILKKVPSESKLLQDSIDRAFNSKEMYPTLMKIKGAISRNDFMALKKGVDTPVSPPRKLPGLPAWMHGNGLTIESKLMHNGVAVKTKKTFYEYNSFIRHLESVEDNIFRGVSNNIMHESSAWWSWSRLGKSLNKSTADYKLYEVLFNRLAYLRKNKSLSTHQEEIYQLLKEVMKGMPRIDLFLRMNIVEAGFEVVDMIRGLFLKKKFALAEYDGGYGKVAKKSKFWVGMKTIIYGSVVSQTGVWVKNMFDEGSKAHQISELFNAKVRDFDRWMSIHNATPEERKCAMSIRPFEFLICFHRHAFTEIGYEWSVAVANNEKLMDNSNLKRRIRAYTDRLVRLRKVFLLAQVYRETSNSFENKFKELAVEELIDRIVSTFPTENSITKDILGPMIYQLFHTDSDEEFASILIELKQYYPDSVTNFIVKAWKDKKELFKNVKDKGNLGTELEGLARALEDLQVEKHSTGVLKLFESDLINSIQHVEFEEKMSAELTNLLSKLKDGEKEGDRNKTIQKVLDKMEQEAEEERLRILKEQEEKRKLEEEILNG